MPTEYYYHLKDDSFISELFSKEWSRLVRYAKVQLSKFGPSSMDIEGRAEETVQELFCTVCDKAEELKQMDNPEGWLYKALKFKVKEVLREDHKWTQGLMLLPDEEESIPFEGTDELAEMIPPEDYRLLRQVYVEGYTYNELCEELGLTKSALGMRINRIKKEFRKKYGNIFNSM